MTNDDKNFDSFDDLGDTAAEIGGLSAKPLALPPRKKGAGATTVAGLLLIAAGLGGGYYFLGGGRSEAPAPIAGQQDDAMMTAMTGPESAAPDTLTFETVDDDYTTPTPADETLMAMTPPTEDPVPAAPEGLAAVPADETPAPGGLLAFEDQAAVPETTVEAVPEAVTETVIEATSATEVPEAAPEVVAPEAPETVAAETVAAETPAPETEAQIAQAEPALSVAAEAEEPQTVPPASYTEPAPVQDEVVASIPVTEVPEEGPSEAELAIIENAAMLDKMHTPEHKGLSLSGAAQTAPAPADLPVTKAIVRPLPKKYLVVKQNHAAGDMDARLTGARVALNQGRNTAALTIFNELKLEYPRDTRIAMGRAVALQRLGMHDDALVAYEEVLNSDPKNLEALTNMLGLIKGADPQIAISRLQELRSTYPGNADITAQLGISYGGAGDFPSALKYLEMAEAMNPGNPHVTYNKAVVYDSMGQSIQAATLYRQIIRDAADGNIDPRALPLDSIRNRLAVLR